jgi:hypothetical protein
MDLELKRIWVKGLMIACPFGKPLDTCPAREIRKLPLEDRMQKVDDMPEGEIDLIISFHKKCLAEREGKETHFYD